MNLLIHDLSEEEFKEISEQYTGWEIMSDNGNIKPCVGCFGCWVKNPGECVIKDGFNRMGALIHEADEVVVISKYTYGGFSSFIKNVFDRSIGFVLPYFEVYKGEMHHKKRYPEDKKMRFIFRGSGLTEADKRKARKYVNAVCTNLHGNVTAIEFQEVAENSLAYDTAPVNDDKFNASRKDNTEVDKKTNRKIILLNCSLRADNANTKKFLDKLGTYLNGNVESINLSKYYSKLDELISILDTADRIVLGMPLYVDGIPSAPLRLMERIESVYKTSNNQNTCNKKIYVVTNMGLYESHQLKHLLSMVKYWCNKCGFTYGGGLAIGAGEMLGGFMASKDISKGPSQNVAEGFERLSKSINSSSSVEDLYVNVKAFPRAMYMFAANMGWPMDAKKNGLKKKDLLKQH